MQINLDISESEVTAIKKYLPMLQHLKQLVPKELVSLLQKIEHHVKEM